MDCRQASGELVHWALAPSENKARTSRRLSPDLAALLILVATLQLFLLMGPMALGTPIGWDLILAALGSSLLLWCALRYLPRGQLLRTETQSMAKAQANDSCAPASNGSQ